MDDKDVTMSAGAILPLGDNSPLVAFSLPNGDARVYHVGINNRVDIIELAWSGLTSIGWIGSDITGKFAFE